MREKLLASTRGDLFKCLYESAKEVVSTSDWVEDEKCPLCESELSSSISQHIKEQLAQYSDAAAKITEISNTWQESAWKKYLSAMETAAPLEIEPQNRQSTALNWKFSSGNISKDDLAASVKWTSDLTEKFIKTLKTAQDRKVGLEKKLPPSLVQLTEQVEYAQQYKNALKLYRNHQQTEVAQQVRFNSRNRWKKFISKSATVFADAEAAFSKARIEGIDTEYKSMFSEIMQIGDVVPDLRRADNKEDLDVQLSNFSWTAQIIRPGAIARKLPQRPCDFGFPRRCTEAFRRTTLCGAG